MVKGGGRPVKGACRVLLPDDRHLLADPLLYVGPLYRLGRVHPEQARVAEAAPNDLRSDLFGRR